MDDRRCFVQFFNLKHKRKFMQFRGRTGRRAQVTCARGVSGRVGPHPETRSARSPTCLAAQHRGEKMWNNSNLKHKRKFMQFRGEWIEQDGGTRTGDLCAWGEWEPESDLIRKLDQPGGSLQYPRYLWHPYYMSRANYAGLHNTDPFIFGERFLYSNCGQTSKPGLKHLGDGSVIAFGSGKSIKGERRWMLDTVLVVKDSVEYRAPEDLMVLDEWVSDAFLVATGGLLTDSGRLYWGATPDDAVDGMFSFFPAMPADGGLETRTETPILHKPSFSLRRLSM